MSEVWVIQVMSLGTWLDDCVYCEQQKGPNGWPLSSPDVRAKIQYQKDLLNWPDIRRRLVRRMISEEVVEVYDNESPPPVYP